MLIFNVCLIEESCAFVLLFGYMILKFRLIGP